MLRIIKTGCILLMGWLIFSCKVEHLTPPNEPMKNIAGSWGIIHAIRNGTDMTNGFDFTKFRIVFTDSTYAIDSLLPFIVTTRGKWVFDDPQYPFNLIFTPADSSRSITAPFLFPVTGGVRNIIFTFSPGCPSNSYQYTLQKVN
ncbi:MAG TPA: DUF5004 domain-containing protein [Puia sp.]|nr:DUF5004 domain-containing protein [Puia sp.]